MKSLLSQLLTFIEDQTIGCLEDHKYNNHKQATQKKRAPVVSVEAVEKLEIPCK